MKKDVKWRFEPYSYYNKSGIEHRLENMAEDGWMIEDIGFSGNIVKLSLQNAVLTLFISLMLLMI